MNKRAAQKTTAASSFVLQPNAQVFSSRLPPETQEANRRWEELQQLLIENQELQSHIVGSKNHKYHQARKQRFGRYEQILKNVDMNIETQRLQKQIQNQQACARHYHANLKICSNLDSHEQHGGQQKINPYATAQGDGVLCFGPNLQDLARQQRYILQKRGSQKELNPHFQYGGIHSQDLVPSLQRYVNHRRAFQKIGSLSSPSPPSYYNTPLGNNTHPSFMGYNHGANLTNRGSHYSTMPFYSPEKDTYKFFPDDSLLNRKPFSPTEMLRKMAKKNIVEDYKAYMKDFKKQKNNKVFKFKFSGEMEELSGEYIREIDEKDRIKFSKINKTCRCIIFRGINEKIWYISKETKYGDSYQELKIIFYIRSNSDVPPIKDWKKIISTQTNKDEQIKINNKNFKTLETRTSTLSAASSDSENCTSSSI